MPPVPQGWYFYAFVCKFSLFFQGCFVDILASGYSYGIPFVKLKFLSLGEECQTQDFKDENNNDDITINTKR